MRRILKIMIITHTHTQNNDYVEKKNSDNISNNEDCNNNENSNNKNNNDNMIVIITIMTITMMIATAKITRKTTKSFLPKRR